MGTTIACIKNGGTDEIPNNGNIFVSCLGVMSGILFTAIFVSLSKFRLRKWFGYWNLIFYISFIVINILVYENILKINVET